MSRPYPTEERQARAIPDGWVYRIAGEFGAAEAVPPAAIVGAWQVDGNGQIVGEFVVNAGYDPARYPPG